MIGESTFPLGRAARRIVAAGLLITLTLPALAQDDQGTTPPPPADQAPPTPTDATTPPPADATAPAAETTPTVPVKPLVAEKPAPLPGSKEATQLETIEVTGSRLKRTDYESAQPVVSISREDIERTGLTDINEILRHLTVAGNASLTPQTGRGFLTLGEVNLDLRNLGATHTLLLVNGHRWVNGLIAQSTSVPDYNTIPTAIIERVEILKDGASAVYGSDAIGGVVNVITRKDYQGFGIDYQAGQYIQQSDGESQQASLNWGSTKPGTSVFVNLNYTTTGLAPTTNRGFTHSSMPLAGNTRDSPTTERGRFVFVPNQQNGAQYQCKNIQGDLAAGFVNDPTGSFSPYEPQIRNSLHQTSVVPAGVTLCEVTLNKDSVGKLGPGSTTTSDYHSITLDDRFNKLLNGSLIEPNDRTALYTQFNQELTEHLSLNLEGLYNLRKSTTVTFNTAYGGGDGLGDNGDLGAVRTSNPYNPFNQPIGYQTACGTDTEATSTSCVSGLPTEGYGIWLMRLLNDRANPNHIQRVRTQRLAASLKGDFELIGLPISWDGGYVYGASKLRESIGLARYDLLGQTLGNPDINNQPTTCVAPCYPLDLFHGQQGLNYDAVEYTFYETTQDNRNRQDIGFVDLSGELPQPFSWMAGPIAMAFGLEARRDRFESKFDPFISLGLVPINVQHDTTGQTFAKEAYVETGIPVLKDLPFAQSADLDLAARYSRYPGFDPVVTYKSGARWQPISDLLIRATYSTGFRAPNVGELYAPETEDGRTVADPCIDPNRSDTTRANCDADNVVPASGSDAVFSANQIWIGNPNLRPEKSKNLTYGIVYSPHFVPDLNIAVDFYRVRLNDAIFVGTGQFFIDNCYKFVQRQDCQYVVRDPDTTILDHMVTPYINFYAIQTSGTDFGVDYILPWTRDAGLGQFKIELTASYLHDYDIIAPIPGGASQTFGNVGTDQFGFIGFPRWKADTTLTWKRDLWRASWSTHMAYKMTETCEDLYGRTDPTVSYHALGLCSDPNPHYFDDDPLHLNPYYENTMDTVFYHNVQVGRELPDYNADISFGVNNVLDHDPEYSLSDNGFAFYNYNPNQYEIPGRFGYMKVSFKF